jgi:peptidoglycan hydrolase-like amidase
MKKALVIIFLGLFLFGLTLRIKADEIDDLGKILIKLNADLNSQTADYQELLQQLEEIKVKIILLGNQIKKGEEALTYQKELLNERVKSYYKNVNITSLSLVDVFVSQNLSESLRKFFYQKSLVDEDKKTIIKVVLYIKNLEDQKTRLAALKIQVDRQTQDLLEKISQTRQKIAELSARQQQLIAQKLASLNISRSAGSMGRCDSDLTNNRDPGFSPRIAFFTYGVPNRVGMNQWGAYGRAKSGQGYEQILRAYYNFDELKGFDTNLKIKVDGYGEFSLEDYVKRIYEVPGDWPAEVLKTQAVAARSYVLAYTNNGSGSICATENCQVFKTEPKGGAWEQAVNDTSGKAMAQGGNAIKAWFSSTHGGYVFASGEIGWSGTSWTKHATDTTGGVNNFSDLQNNAYDKESPWFYCDWGSRSEYNKTAWLRPSEVADIVNTILLAKRDSSVGEHLYQPDKPNPAGTETWDAEKVKRELRSRGISPYNSITDISVSADFGFGRTTSVQLSGDAGSSSIDASEFKNWFNLRAPSNIQIVGPLFNAEKR